MKKTLALVLALAMVFALCACGSTTTTANTPTQESTTTATATAAAAAVTSDPKDPQSQVALFYQNLSSLVTDEAGRTFWYMVTDLDHNGRLEFVSALTEGSGNFTSANVYEIGADYASIAQVSIKDSSDFLPEIICRSTDVLTDNAGYHYVFTDTNSDALNGSGHYMTKGTVTLSNGAIDYQILASQDVSYMNGYTVYTTYDNNGNVIDNPNTTTVDTIIENVYPNATKSTVNFDWFSLSEATSATRLYTSYCVFAGTTAPTATPVATATPAPTNNIRIIDVSNPVVTKDPTSESLTAGGSCSFVAQAIGYNTMKWQLIDTNGHIYDVAGYNPFPATLNIYGATGQTLTLSGVPQDMNGWQVQAVFTGDTETVKSTPATIYVSAAPSPEYVTISFYPSDGSTFYDDVTYVSVYSSNGANIHVEAIKGGDTGAYYSADLPSGGSFPVQGVTGQYIPVDVYASCGNSQVHVYFYVNSQPTPTPTTKTGTVTDVNTEGGNYYIGVDWDDGSCGRYDVTYLVSNPPSAGQRVGGRFASDGYTLSELWFQ